MTDEILPRLENTLHTVWGTHRHDLVAEAARKILAVQPDHRDALLALASAQYHTALSSKQDQAERLDAMLATCQAALKAHPQDAWFYYYIYLYYLWHGGSQYLLARDAMLKAIKLQPENAYWYRQLGEIYLINREANKAARHIGRAVELDPGEAEYRSRLALALLRQHKVDQSMAAARQALSEAPDNPKVLDTVGMIYILAGDLDAADKFFRDAIRRIPTYNYFQQHIDWIEREQKDQSRRTAEGKRYTPLYLRHKGTKRFFDEDRID